MVCLYEVTEVIHHHDADAQIKYLKLVEYYLHKVANYVWTEYCGRNTI